METYFAQHVKHARAFRRALSAMNLKLVCVYVCVCVCVCVNLCSDIHIIYVHACAHTKTFTTVHTNMHSYVLTHVRTYVQYIHAKTEYSSTCVHAHILLVVPTDAHECMHRYAHAHTIHVCVLFFRFLLAKKSRRIRCLPFISRR